MTATNQGIFIHHHTRADGRQMLQMLGSAGDDRIAGGTGPDLIGGREGNDFIIDTIGDNVIYGHAGDDVLIGYGTFTGGPGDDLIRGDGLFRFYLGDGHDTIGSRSYVAGGDVDNGYAADHHLNDSILRFGPGIAPSAVKLRRRHDDLQFMFDADHSVTVEHWFSDSNCQLGRVEFSDGQVWERAAINAMSLPPLITGTADRDTLQGTGMDDIILGQAGGDIISAPEGDNLILGGAGNDIIIGRGAIHGGAGDDTIAFQGNSPTNICYYKRGDGHDTLYVNGAGCNGALSFLALEEDQLWFRRQDEHLVITVVGSDDGVTIADWYLGAGKQVSRFEVGGHKTMPADRVDALVQAMARFDPPSSAHSRLSPYTNYDLTDILAASWTSIETS